MEERLIQAENRGLLHRPPKPCTPEKASESQAKEGEPKTLGIGKGAMVVSGD